MSQLVKVTSGIVATVAVIVCMVMIFSTLGMCYASTGVGEPVSACGRVESNQRILFIACFAVSTGLVLLFVPGRLIALHCSTWFGLSPQYKSIYFWFMVLHLIPMVLSMPFLLVMAIIPDGSELSTLHFVFAIVGMGLVLFYGFLNVVLNFIRMIRLFVSKSYDIRVGKWSKKLPNVVCHLLFSTFILINVGLIIGAVVGLLEWRSGNLLGEWIGILLIVGQLGPIFVECILLIFVSEQDLAKEDDEEIYVMENPNVESKSLINSIQQ